MNDMAAVVLAAGMSMRMGTQKVLLQFRGKPLFRHAVDVALAAGLEPVVVVGGQEFQQLEASVRGLPVEVIRNTDYAAGMSTSLKAGISAVRATASAAMVLLADQPFVPVVLIQRLTDVLHRDDSMHIVAVRPRFAGIPGHPVLIRAEWFPELLKLEGDEGARSLLQQQSDRVTYLDVDNSVWGHDLDTPEDWRRVQTITETDLLE